MIMQSLVLHVEGMSCGHCVSAVEKALQDLGAKGTVDLAGKKVEVQYDESRLGPDKIKEAIEEQGYDVV